MSAGARLQIRDFPATAGILVTENDMPIDQRIEGILSVLREEFEKGAASARDIEHLQGQLRTQV